MSVQRRRRTLLASSASWSCAGILVRATTRNPLGTGAAASLILPSSLRSGEWRRFSVPASGRLNHVLDQEFAQLFAVDQGRALAQMARELDRARG